MYDETGNGTCHKFWKLGLVLEVRLRRDLRRDGTLHAYPAFLYLVVARDVTWFLS